MSFWLVKLRRLFYNIKLDVYPFIIVNDIIVTLVSLIKEQPSLFMFIFVKDSMNRNNIVDFYNFVITLMKTD